MTKIGRYVVISELGRGAMGIVYKASDPTIGREVALKVLSLNTSPEGGTNSPQQMFMREVRAAGRLAHPSIVTIHDAFEDQENQTSCIVMELVPGLTLEKILDSGHPLTTEQTLSIVRQVAEGLDYAHRNQVIHRDLKPANILVTEDGRAKITDFGIAKVLAREGMARTIGVMGTPSYMSPEQVRGGEVDGRTDIFSLGIIIFTMLSGKKPFTGNTAAVMFKIVYEEPAVPSSVNPQLTPAYDYVVKKCLAKDRNLRYSSARELLVDLDDLQHGRPLRSQAVAPAPAPAAPPAPAAAPRPDQTPAMPIPGPMKAAPPPPAPPAPPTAPPPVTPVEAGGPVAPPPFTQTLDMPISGLMKAASQRPSPPPAPPQRAAAPPPKPAAAPPVTPMKAGGPVTPPPLGQTLAMPIQELMKGASLPPSPGVVSAPPASPPVPVQRPKPVIPPPVTPVPHPDARPLTGQILPRRVPDLSAVTASVPPSPQPAPMPSASDGATQMMGRTLPKQAPDLSAVSSQAPSSPRAVPAPPAPPDYPFTERTFPMQARDVPAAPQAVEPQPVTTAPPPQPVGAPAEEPAGTSGDVLPAPKSKLIPVMFGGLAIALLAAAMWGYWKFRQIRTAPAPPPQVVVQTPPVTPPPAPVSTPVATPTPPPAAAAEQPTPPISAAPGVAKKTAVHRPKQVIVPPPSAPAPAPPPAQPQPVIVTPPPMPSPPTPSPEAIAKAEAAKFANIPRIVQVLCNFGFKEATFTFSSGGQTLFEETLKGKKKKGGFLGIKGSYEGTFTHTITVPAGASEVSIHVVAKDGATDLSKTIKMPPPGGFVPTLAVEVDADHLSPNWKSSAAAK